ncbi:MAG: ribonuclease P protein component [Prolixibacteraceae bacterium]|jgi:ribonuclease P protein component|nr:ribonuclease P protein component [Prolixibacteraceae bacterium]
MQHQFRFSKNERLSSKIIIDKLFADGKPLFAFPFRIILLQIENDDTNTAKVLFSVPKRNFKKAVHRNLIRRRMREAYRLNRNNFTLQLSKQNHSLAVMFIYIEKEIKDYPTIEKGMIKALKKIQQTLNPTKSIPNDK